MRHSYNRQDARIAGIALAQAGSIHHKIEKIEMRLERHLRYMQPLMPKLTLTLSDSLAIAVRRWASERFDSHPLARRLSRNKTSPSKNREETSLFYLAGFTRRAASPDSYGKTLLEPGLQHATARSSLAVW